MGAFRKRFLKAAGLPARLAGLAWLAIAAAAAVSPAAAQNVGAVLQVKPGARIETGGRTLELRRRQAISNGDVIVTDATGTAQLVFKDRTRIAVGPNSRFEVQDVSMGANRKAERFAVSTVSGAFRFLSGRSNKSAYAVNTPTATMGIRGTIFDFSVVQGRATNLITFQGQVRICSTSNRCARVSGRCAAFGATRIGRLFQPEDEATRDALIRAEFPFIVSQQDLRPEFQTDVEACGDAADKVFPRPVIKEAPDNSSNGRSTPSQAPSSPQN